jgi:hypothetical protein
VLTALAARSLFKSGFAFRLMSANPCMTLCLRCLVTVANQFASQGLSLE